MFLVHLTKSERQKVNVVMMTNIKTLLFELQNSMPAPCVAVAKK